MLKKQPQHSLRKRFFARFKNTFLQIPCLWGMVIDHNSFKEQHSTKLRRIFMKAAWFWPRLIDAEQWRDGAIGKQRDPNHFIEIDSQARKLVDEVIFQTPDKNAPILDLGCNCGRLINELRIAGYTNLHGVDISQAANDHMHVVFPELAAMANYSVSTFQEYLEKLPDGAMETIGSHGATVELVHPSFPLVKHLCRVARSHVVLLIVESGHSYPRFWEWEFNRYGFILAKALRPSEEGSASSLLVFSRAS